MIRRESVVWGIVGGLSFLVLLQGYELLAAFRVGLASKFGVALLVTLASTALAHLAAARLGVNGRA